MQSQMPQDTRQFKRSPTAIGRELNMHVLKHCHFAL